MKLKKKILVTVLTFSILTTIFLVLLTRCQEKKTTFDGEWSCIRKYNPYPPIPAHPYFPIKILKYENDKGKIGYSITLAPYTNNFGIKYYGMSFKKDRLITKKIRPDRGLYRGKQIAAKIKEGKLYVFVDDKLLGICSEIKGVHKGYNYKTGTSY